MNVYKLQKILKRKYTKKLCFDQWTHLYSDLIAKLKVSNVDRVAFDLNKLGQLLAII